MKLRVVCIGKVKDAAMAGWISDYSTRVRRFLPLEITEIADPKVEESRKMQVEGAKLLAAVDPSDRVVVLDPKGQQWTSEQFAEFVQKHMQSDPRRLNFIIGGANGLLQSVKSRAEVTWALSALTFTHDLTRVLVLEQIYRALSIIHNHPYSR